MACAGLGHGFGILGSIVPAHRVAAMLHPIVHRALKWQIAGGISILKAAAQEKDLLDFDLHPPHTHHLFRPRC